MTSNNQCKKTIWTGRYNDEYGIFEILVPACNKHEAYDKINKSIKDIKEGRKLVTKKIGNEEMIYVEEVGDFDYIREDYVRMIKRERN